MGGATVCAEVGSFERFGKPAFLSGSSGIVPFEYTSDTKRVQGQITKAGPPHARRLSQKASARAAPQTPGCRPPPPPPFVRSRDYPQLGDSSGAAEHS
jgi:hypothetical protein